MSEQENISLNVENNVQEQQDQVKQTPQEQPAQPAQPVQPAQLTLNVLLNVKNVVDLAIARGAFKPNELSRVGSIYDNFVSGLNTLQTQNELNKIEDN